MKKLFLASYFTKVKSLFRNFIKDSCEDKKILFIPTAAVPEKVTFYVNADKKTLKKMNYEVDEMEISKLPKDEVVRRIENSSCIFVEGGNTFFLLQEFRRLGADKAILEHINKGKPYIGSSAGSMILSPNIGYATLMDNPAVAPELNNDYTALGSMNFYIVPHYGNMPFNKSSQKIVNKFSDILDIRPINNSQVIVVNGNNTEILSTQKI
jgi:dipeptidase E